MISKPIGLTLLGGGVLLAAHQGGAGLSPPAADPDRPVGHGSTISGWVYPMPRWRDYAPTVSDGPGPGKRDGGKRGHNGADIDYRRKSRSDLLSTFKPGTREGSGGGMFFCPYAWPIIAARDGKIWSTASTSRGIQMVIDHGKPFATYYQHMCRIFFPLGLSRGEGGHLVKAGQVIGLVGNGSDPGDAADNAFTHLHFEVWRDGGAESWIDPTDILKSARVLSIGDVLTTTVPGDVVKAWRT